MREIYKQSISKAMDEWRSGIRGAIPYEYIQLHVDFASKDAYRFLVAQNCKYAGEGIYRDLDNPGGMKYFRLFADAFEGIDGKLREYRFLDANGGSWFRVLPSGALSLVEIPENNPGHL